MIDFTCPGCQSPHKANEAFAGRRAKCVRCGATLHIPHISGEATFAEHAVLETDEEREQRFEYARQMAAEEGAAENGESAVDPTKKRKKPLRLLAAILAFLLIGGGICYFVFMGEPPPVVKKKEAPPIEEELPPPPPPVVEAPKVVVPPPPAPILVNADRLHLEYIRDQKGTDAKYGGKLLEVRGNCFNFLVARLEFQTSTAGGDVAIGGIRAVLPAYLNHFGEDKEVGLALLGSMAAPALAVPGVRPTAGRPVAVRGVYWGSGNLKNAQLVRLMAPADDLYLGKPVIVEGVVLGVDEGDHGAAIVTFVPATTVPVVTISCRFLVATSKEAQKLRPGDRTIIGGTCSGRDWLTVKLENCAIGNPPGGAGGTPVRVAAPKLMADYEADLLRYPPIPPDLPPLKVSAEQLAVAYRENAATAEAKYAMRRLIVTGYVLRREERTKTVRFETGTDSGGWTVRSALLPADYARVPTDEPELSFIGDFYGKGSSNLLQLESAKHFDPDAGNPNVQLLTADYLPTAPGRQWTALRVAYTDAPKNVKVTPFAKPKPHEQQVSKLQYRILPDRRMQAVLLQSGSTTGKTLFADDAPEIKWFGKPLPVAGPFAKIVETAKFRTTEWYVELGIAYPKGGGDDAPPAGADPKDAGYQWQPFLRLNSKVGRVWTHEPAPGVSIKMAVESFGKDTAGRPTVKLLSVMTDAKFKGKRLETELVLVKGIGEVKRVLTLHDSEGAKVLMEQKLDGEPKQVEELTLERVAEVKRFLDAFGRAAVRRIIPGG